MPYGKKRNYARMAKKAVRKPKANGIKASKPVINPLLKRYVKSVVARGEETKYTTASIAYKSNIVGAGFNTTGPIGYNTITNIIPTVYQGSTNYQRNGNRISPVGNLLVRGHVLALPVSTTTNPFPNTPFYVRIVVWRARASMSTIFNSDILDDNIAPGGTSFDGTLDDMLLPYNKDKYIIASSKTIMLQPNATSTGTYASENLSKFPVSKMFKMYIPLPKVLVYNDTSSDPSNCRWYLSAGVCNVDGTLPISSQWRASITAEALIKFKDA